MYIFSPFFFKSQIQCHSFRELFLSYTTKILPMALYHLIPSISFVVHIAPRKLIIYLLLSLPPPIPLAVEHTIQPVFPPHVPGPETASGSEKTHTP